MKRLPLFLLPLLLLSCTELSVDATSTAPPQLIVTNATGQALAVVVFNQEDLPLIDPLPALTAGAFAERRIEAGQAASIAETPDYTLGNAAFVLVYAECDCELDPQLIRLAGPGAVPLLQDLTLTARELEARGFRIRIDRL